ncbi:hypothetical protein KC19_3G205100 [Ceratodon purpureus]|uniref:Ubiquitin carboxyl-terminal hydrolase n=2 Tax=Ceratodon purpureus TaxID=3225 RepID=A0A8T0IMV6_CERPU|nr:hypothetical protein KC19_3G205100 [Ceratodon purpureus]
MGAAAMEVDVRGSGATTVEQRKRMGVDPATQSGAWLPSAGAPPRRVNFRPALNKDQGMASSSHPSSSSLPRPLNSSAMAGKGLHRAGPSAAAAASTSTSAHEPLSWTPAARIGAGLSNLGNTCFLNSVLQCLTYTPPLAGYLDSGQHKTTCRAAGFCAMCALQEHVRQALASSGGAVSPSNLVKNLRCISKSFRMWRQEDAHEYLRCLIEGLHNCCLPPGVKSNSAVSQERSLIHKIFGGRLRSQVKCTVCSTCSNTYDPLLDLSLEIVRADSLTKALNRFTAVEALEGDNKYHCSHCRKKVRALKQFTIDKSPNILTIQFKRFSGTGSSGGKIDKKIEFGRTLDMKPYISNPQATDAKYSLYAVLVHAGWSTHSGHYYCFVRTKGDMWHALDDSRVKQVSEKSVLDQKAYILFYIKDSVTQSSAGAEQLLRNSLPAFKKLLSDGAAETADDSSADDLDHNGRQASNGHASQNMAERGVPAAKSQSNPPVRPAGNSQSSSRNDTVDTFGGASNLTSESDGPVLEMNGKPAVKVNVDNGKVKSSANGANTIENETVDKMDAEVVVERDSETTSNGTESSALSSENPVVSTAASVKVVTIEESKKFENGEADCSTSGEDDDDDDTDWDEYHKHFSNTPQSYMRLLYAMPHTRRYFMARSLPIQRDRKRPGCKKGQCQVENGHGELTANGGGKTLKRLCCAGEGNSGLSKKQKLVNGQEESSNGDGVNGSKVNGSGSEHVSVLRERLQSNGTCQAEESGVRAPDVALNGDHVTIGSNGQMNAGFGAKSITGTLNGCADAHKKVDSTTANGLGAGSDLGLDRCSKAAVLPAKNSLHSQSNGLYDLEVPRWGEVEANGNGSVKDVDSLLRTHKTVVPVRDSWDEEYDRGKVKKVRNKEKQAGFDVNPFQAVANSSKQRLQAEARSTIDD